MVYVSTTAYNAEKTLSRCIESILNQTYKGDIAFYICDNGSNDSTGKIINEYAAKDSRIYPFYNHENQVYNEKSQIYLNLSKNISDDDYICWLDSDDYYATDFLQKMISFMETNNLDLAACGYKFISAENSQVIGERVLNYPLIVSKPNEFADYYAIYHQFMRPQWAKIYKGSVVKHMPTTPELYSKLGIRLTYGVDTLKSFSILRHTKRFGILPQTLHFYYVSNKSISYEWNPARIDSDQILYKDAEDFLQNYGPISEQNRKFIDLVYANAVSDTVNVLDKTDLAAEEKLKELNRIAEYPVTREAYNLSYPDTQNSKKNVVDLAFKCAMSLKQENDDFNHILSLLSPDCAPAVTNECTSLFIREPMLLQSLAENDRDALVQQILKMISEGKYIKQFDLGKMISRLTFDKLLLHNITSTKFLRRHGDIYLMVWQEKYGDALVAMTEHLLSGKQADEDYLQLYLSLAAVLECANEFIFGKIKAALYYFSEKRYDECRAAINDLSDMGVEDTAEIAEIKNQLGN